VAIKSRYFVAAVMALETAQPQFGGALAVGGPRPGNSQTDVSVVTSLPAPRGEFRHSVYVGPQEYRRLKQIGHDFEDVNPYGWVFRPIIRPFANFIVLILLWMHETLRIGYGWVLILFGILVRLILWPLNQKAMRSSTAMQALQPDIKAIQERYAGKKDVKDQQKMQQEIMALYKEHGVNPLGGCLPLLIPMPVLFALFFVFANTIEFRGVSFLWLPDLSRPDPVYVIPLLMGGSMFALSWIGQRGLPPNPQTKMMMYIMPGIFTFMFLNFSSGLNLYYAVSNIASLPQQWLISQERKRKLGERRQGKG
jgi:YidC/Oxa1 family membrane protein insertase